MEAARLWAADSFLGGCELAGCWLRGLDLNQRPLGYEPNELPGCSTPRKHYSGSSQDWQRLFIAFRLGVRAAGALC